MNEKDTERGYMLELVVAPMERTIRRFWILTILLAVLLAGSWIGFFVYESQFETVSQEVKQDADNGTNNFVGGDYYGQSDYQDYGSDAG